MGSVSLHLLDVTTAGPENFVCMALQPEGQSRVVTIWSEGPEATVAMAHIRGVADAKRRAVDALIELLDQLGGVSRIEVVSYHEGVFLFDVTAEAGHSVEVSATDAVIIAHNYDMAIDIDEDLLAQVAVFATPEDLQEYMGVGYATPVQGDAVSDVNDVASDTSASGDPQADADFEAMMRSLGMDEGDFGDGAEGN